MLNNFNKSLIGLFLISLFSLTGIALINQTRTYSSPSQVLGDEDSFCISNQGHCTSSPSCPGNYYISDSPQSGCPIRTPRCCLPKNPPSNIANLCKYFQKFIGNYCSANPNIPVEAPSSYGTICSVDKLIPDSFRPITTSATGCAAGTYRFAEFYCKSDSLSPTILPKRSVGNADTCSTITKLKDLAAKTCSEQSYCPACNETAVNHFSTSQSCQPSKFSKVTFSCYCQPPTTIGGDDSCKTREEWGLIADITCRGDTIPISPTPTYPSVSPPTPSSYPFCPDLNHLYSQFCQLPSRNLSPNPTSEPYPSYFPTESWGISSGPHRVSPTPLPPSPTPQPTRPPITSTPEPRPTATPTPRPTQNPGLQPTDISIHCSDDGKATITWTDAANEIKYNIAKRNANNTWWNYSYGTVGRDITTYTDPVAHLQNVTYYYNVFGCANSNCTNFSYGRQVNTNCYPEPR